MNAYVGAGYGVTVLVLALYALRIIQRARTLRRALPAEATDVADVTESTVVAK